MAMKRHLAKIAAFDIDDEEDQRLYNKIKDDPRTDQWLKGTHDDLKFDRNMLGLGALASGAGAYASHRLISEKYPELVKRLGADKLPWLAKKIVGKKPYAVTAGLGGLAAYLGYKALRKGMDLGAYDRGEYSDRRKQNIERYMRNHGSEYMGRREQREADAKRRADFVNNLILAHAIYSQKD